MNNLLAEVLRMKAQGMSPMAARQQLMQRFPKLQASPFANANNPREIDVIAQNTARSMGIDPQELISNARRMMR